MSMKDKAKNINIVLLVQRGVGLEQPITYLQLPFVTSNITQPPAELVDAPAFGVLWMGGEVPLEAGITKAGRAGSSHSLLVVLMVSNVPMLEEAEVDEALGLFT